MFQLSAQLKSQFTEIENLLSQITYVHFHNDEYQRRIDRAYKDSILKRIRGAVVVGMGIGAMTTISEWATLKQRKELTEVQLEKEFKKNKFLFTKAIDLIRHMDAFTIPHHVDVLNQFTFETLQLEAKEIMVLDSDHGRRGELSKQSVHLYTKNTLPVDFDQGLVPQRVVTSILEKPSKTDEGIASLSWTKEETNMYRDPLRPLGATIKDPFLDLDYDHIPDINDSMLDMNYNSIDDRSDAFLDLYYDYIPDVHDSFIKNRFHEGRVSTKMRFMFIIFSEPLRLEISHFGVTTCGLIIHNNLYHIY